MLSMLSLFILIFFCFAFFSAYLDLRCTTQDEVLQAIERTKRNYPESNLNSLTKKKE